MSSIFTKNQNRLVYHFDAETLWVESWGKNSLRVRATRNAEMPYTLGAARNNWALLPPEPCTPEITIGDDGASVRNGKIELRINKSGQITVYNQKGEILLEEYVRSTRDNKSRTCSALMIDGREFKSVGGDE
jgi:alpha-D-xyloside xylohydrolase